MLCGRLPPDAGGGGAFGLRAFCNIPRGVEEDVIEAVVEGSETDRREGTRWIFVDPGLSGGEDSPEEVGE
jgi:hypothetical protein